ncbi:MAG: aminotransferase class V-fold PLP-dependent enzyme [Candidatus Korobacteraceae bacterium]|jgi:cysteine desulfurase
MRRVYLDNNATTPLLPEVFEAMRPYFLEKFGNASSIHQQGQQARAAVEQARDSVAGLLGARAAEIVFTSGGTEGDNLAIFGLVAPGDHIITSAVEHHAVLNSCKRAEALGVEVTYLPVDGEGLVDPGEVRAALRPNTRLISVMMANNETGAVQPVEEIGRIAAEAGVRFHTDAVQAAGKLPIDVGRIRCDLLSISAHKLHGPQGVGALFVRKGTLLQPLLHGGRHERGRRAGTENLPGIVGLGKAASLASEWLAGGGAAKMASMRDRFEQRMLSEVELTRCNSGKVARTPNTSNIIFECIEGEALVIALDLKGISVSTGAACSSGAVEPSHVLTAMGLTASQARASIRFSLGKQTTEDDLDFVLDQAPAAVAKLRELSPVWKKAVSSF